MAKKSNKIKINETERNKNKRNDKTENEKEIKYILEIFMNTNEILILLSFTVNDLYKIYYFTLQRIL